MSEDFENENFEENGNDENDKKKKLKLIIIFIAVFLIIFLGIQFGSKLYNQYMIDKPATTQNTTTTQKPAQTKPDEKEKVPNPIDFKALQKGNDEIYAHIIVEDTNVNYPICQSKVDDAFYLKHRAEDKSWSASGAIYTEIVNSKDFGDRVTLIYGHNGYSDTFFTTLHKFEDKDFFDSHPYFYIYTPKRKLTYQIVSAFKYDNRHIMNSFNFSQNSVFLEFEEFIADPDSALKNVRKELDTKLDINSKIAILSTCITNQKGNRYLVCGVLVKDEQTY